MPSSTGCAASVLDMIPSIMLTIRGEVMQQRMQYLSVPEFRALGYIMLHPGTSLSDVAEHVGTPLPSMSKMIEGLAQKRLLIREMATTDRRKVCLTLTPAGEALLQEAKAKAQQRLAEHLSTLSPEEQLAVTGAMDILKKVFPAQMPLIQQEPMAMASFAERGA